MQHNEAEVRFQKSGVHILYNANREEILRKNVKKRTNSGGWISELRVSAAILIINSDSQLDFGYKKFMRAD